MSLEAFFKMTLVFWIVMDSAGNIPIYVSMLSKYEPKHQRRIIMREMLIALAIMILFLFFGEAFFKLINIDTATLQIAGGAILFLIALRLLFSTPTEKKMHLNKEPLIVPLAVPAVAGPGILATITLYSGGLGATPLYITLGIIVAWGFSLPVLLVAPLLRNVIGKNGLAALERLFGYIIILIAIQMALKGLITTLHA